MKKNTLILLAFVIVKFIIQYMLISPEYDLHRDEYLHLDQARHLAWGYLSVPPFTSWISYLIMLLGNGVFWIKFFPALFGALTMVVVWKTIEELKGNLFALLLGAVAILFSVLLRINILYQPNSLDILLWTLFYFTIVKYIDSENDQWLYLAAVTFAFGFLNKYNIVFLLLGLLPAILLTAQRKIFVKKQLYFAVVLAAIIISPNLVWQYNNNFPVFHHLEQLARTQLVNVNRIDFVKEQILFFIGSLFVIIAALISFFTYKPFKKYQVFFWSFLFTLLIFIYLKAKAYYAIGLYPILLAFGAVYIEQLLKNGWKKVYLRPAAIAIPVLLFIPMLRVAFPNISPLQIEQNPQRYKDLDLLRWEDGKDHSLPQDFADMQGWKELAYKVESIYTALPNEQQTLILCDNYGQAGAINYYAKNKEIGAVSFNADYIDWFNLNKKYDNLIRIKTYEVNNDELMVTSPFFDSAVVGGSITNRFAREYKTTIYVFRNAKIDINKRIKEEIKKVKSDH